MRKHGHAERRREGLIEVYRRVRDVLAWEEDL